MIIEEPVHQFLDSFCVAGINYRKSDISIRGKFSLLPEHSILVLKQAVEKRFPGCMVLSTCNRTEIYGICDHPSPTYRNALHTYAWQHERFYRSRISD